MRIPEMRIPEYSNKDYVQKSMQAYNELPMLTKLWKDIVETIGRYLLLGPSRNS